jgi:iron complex outermembrane recepter protein
MSFKRTAIYSTLSAICLGAPIQSMAQGPAMLEEVVVTARKKEESLQSTPVAVTALSEDMMYTMQVTEIGDLRRTTPNLSILQGGTGSSALVFTSIRGAGQVAPGGGADAAVGTYIDGVYYARPTGGNLNMLDVAQAEILRGPQGTLFGRNTTGGALNIVTNNPTGEFDGYIAGEVGNYSRYQGEAVINVPIMGQELAARVAVRYTERDGYGDYKPYSDSNGFYWEGLNQEGGKVDEDTNVRGKILWAPSDSTFQLLVGGWYGKIEDTGQRTQVQAINSNFGLGPLGTTGSLFAAAGFDPNNFISQQKEGDAYWNMDNTSGAKADEFDDGPLSKPESSNENKGGFIDFSIELGDYFLKSITAYGENTSTGAVDLDGTPLNLLTFNSIWDQDQWSQEFQLSSSWGELDWIAGAYYFTEDSSELSRSRAFGALNEYLLTAFPLEVVAPVNAGSDSDFTNESAGAFFQGNYELTDALRVTAGFRYTWDTRDVTFQGLAPENGGVYDPTLGGTGNCVVLNAGGQVDNPGTCKKSDSADFDYPAWILSLDYQVSDGMFVYAKTSGASMSGGWNVRATVVPAFEPEDVYDVEVGFKSDFLDNTMRLNGAFFYMWADDQQRTVNEWDSVTQSTTQYVRNASSSESYGGELEFSWAPWEGMTISSSLAYLDSEYQDYDIVEGITTGPNAGQSVVVDHSNENAPLAPEWTASIAATQFFQTGMGELELHLDYSWVDDTWFADSTVVPGESEEVQAYQREGQAYWAIPSYGLLNGLVRLRTNDEHWELTVWGRNLADEEYFTGVANFYSAFGTANWFEGDPRTYGATVRYNW